MSSGEIATSVDRLPKWKQQPQVNGVCPRDCLNRRPRNFHPIGVQEHHRTMGTPVRDTTPLLEKSIGIIMPNDYSLGAVRKLLLQSLQFDNTLCYLLDEEVVIKRWLYFQGNGGTPFLKGRCIGILKEERCRGWLAGSRPIPCPSKGIHIDRPVGCRARILRKDRGIGSEIFSYPVSFSSVHEPPNWC